MYSPAGRPGFVACTQGVAQNDHRAGSLVTATAFERFRSGDSAAFDDLVREYTGPAFATAIQVLKDAARAEEAVQDAFLRLWQRARQFDPERGVERSWILAIVRNSAIDAFRKQAKAMERSIEDAPAVYALRDPADTWQQVLEGLTGDRVRLALEELPPDQQQVVVQAYYEGIRPVEIARRLGIPEGTVRSRLRLALAKLRETLEPVREELTP